MELTTILGVIVGVVAVVGAMIFKHIDFAVLLNPAAFFVIIVGTIATILNSFPGKNLKKSALCSRSFLQIRRKHQRLS